MKNYQTLVYGDIEIQKAVTKIAQVLNSEMSYIKFDKPPVFIGILNGAFMFFSDLVRQLDHEIEVDFISYRSYVGKNQGTAELLKDTQLDLEGRHVFLVDDMWDSGNTIQYLKDYLYNKHKAKVIIPVTLIWKRHSDIVPPPSILIYGIEKTTDTWLSGYGLDSGDGTKRNYTCIVEEPRD